MHLKNDVHRGRLMQIIALVTNLSKEANRVDPDQTATICAARSGSTVFAIETS